MGKFSYRCISAANVASYLAFSFNQYSRLLDIQHNTMHCYYYSSDASLCTLLDFLFKRCKPGGISQAHLRASRLIEDDYFEGELGFK